MEELTDDQKLLCWMWHEMAPNRVGRPGRWDGHSPLFAAIEKRLRGLELLTANGEIVDGVVWEESNEG